MGRLLPAIIAGRYLRSKKSHTAVGAIATVSVIGMAVATAAIVCVLSVFNGFRSVIGERLDTLAPDVLAEPAKGKVFDNAEQLAAEVAALPGVEAATPVLADNALLLYNGREMPVFLSGVNPADYSRVTDIAALIPKDMGRLLEPGISHGIPQTTLSVGVAQQMGLYPGDRLLLFAPRRKGRVNIANPATSFISDSLYVAGVYQAMSNDYDADRIITDMATARRLFQYDTQASSLHIKAARDADPADVARTVAKKLGDAFTVKDRMRQQEMNFRMVEIEKWVSYLLLGFILMIAGFNIISTLSMLVLEKEHSLSTLWAMGMTRRRIGSIFAWESFMVALLGGLSGIAVGVALTLLQQHFGIIKIGDGASTILPAYPVKLVAADIPAAMLPILAIAAVTALTTARFARSRI